MQRLDDEAIRNQLSLLEGWTLKDGTIAKTFRFPAYKAAIAFVNGVAAIAEERNHHPDLLVKYGSVEVSYTSHDAGGLTMADFESARAVDALLG